MYIYSYLVKGDHTRHIQQSTSSVGGLMKFVQKTETCLGCKVPLKNNRKGLCEHCKPRYTEIYLNKREDTVLKQNRFSQLWTECQRCQGSLHQEVICSNRDCPIFYMRKKAQKDVTDAMETMDKLNLSW